MTTPHALASEPIDPELIEDYARRGASPPAIENRRKAALRFTRLHNGIEAWGDLPVVDRLAEPVVMRTYAAWAAVEHGMAVDADYVVGTSTHWSNHVQRREPAVHGEFVAISADLGFNVPETKRMWATLAKLSVISGIPAGTIANNDYTGPARSTSTRSTGAAARSRKPSRHRCSASTRSCSTSTAGSHPNAGPETATANRTGTP